MAVNSQRMLDGYRVLDFTQVLAGPITSRYLIEMAPRSSSCRPSPISAASSGIRG